MVRHARPSLALERNKDACGAPQAPDQETWQLRVQHGPTALPSRQPAGARPLMGRTVPSFRIAEMQEVGEWRAFRKALPKRERQVFDKMLDTARLYISA